MRHHDNYTLSQAENRTQECIWIRRGLTSAEECKRRCESCGWMALRNPNEAKVKEMLQEPERWQERHRLHPSDSRQDSSLSQEAWRLLDHLQIGQPDSTRNPSYVQQLLIRHHLVPKLFTRMQQAQRPCGGVTTGLLGINSARDSFYALACGAFAEMFCAFDREDFVAFAVSQVMVDKKEGIALKEGVSAYELAYAGLVLELVGVGVEPENRVLHLLTQRLSKLNTRDLALQRLIRVLLAHHSDEFSASQMHERPLAFIQALLVSAKEALDSTLQQVPVDAALIAEALSLNCMAQRTPVMVPTALVELLDSEIQRLATNWELPTSVVDSLLGAMAASGAKLSEITREKLGEWVQRRVDEVLACRAPNGECWERIVRLLAVDNLRRRPSTLPGLRLPADNGDVGPTLRII